MLLRCLMFIDIFVSYNFRKYIKRRLIDFEVLIKITNDDLRHNLILTNLNHKKNIKG